MLTCSCSCFSASEFVPTPTKSVPLCSVDRYKSPLFVKMPPCTQLWACCLWTMCSKYISHSEGKDPSVWLLHPAVTISWIWCRGCESILPTSCLCSGPTHDPLSWKTDSRTKCLQKSMGEDSRSCEAKDRWMLMHCCFVFGITVLFQRWHLVHVSADTITCNECQKSCATCFCKQCDAPYCNSCFDTVS